MISSDRIRKLVYPGMLGILFIGCTSTPRFTTRSDRPDPSSEVSPPPTRSPESNGRVLLTLEGIASFYADQFHGRKTSNGEVFDMNGRTAAHRTFPFGTKILVTNLENNKTLIIRVNDRGPFHEDRIIDLSLGAAKDLGFEQKGTARVRLEIVEWGDGK
jgi:rare lipoprotein A